MATVTYYAYNTDELLLRRTEGTKSVLDEIWRQGSWQPTSLVFAYMAGQDDDIDAVTETVARKIAPAAF